MAPGNGHFVVDNNDRTDIDIPGDSNRDPMDIVNNRNDNNNNTNNGGDEPEHKFYNYRVYQHLAGEGRIRETETRVQIENQPVRNQKLLRSPHDLLPADPYVKAMRLFYADILAEHGLEYRTQHQDKTSGFTRGVPRRGLLPKAVQGRRESLLQPQCADPVELEPNSLPADDDFNDENLRLILDAYVRPAEIFQAKADAASAIENVGDGDVPFELWDRDCEPLKTRMFTAPQKRRFLRPLR
ncbi:hypothetical protein FSOLCH5_000387 [Fusarium solani]